ESPAELMKFTGHERDLQGNDPHTLDMMHARYEMGTLGRFMSVDRMLDLDRALQRPQAWNRYAYVENSPVVYTDADGKELNVNVNMYRPIKNDPLGPALLSMIHWNEVREAFHNFGSAPANEKAMALAVGAIAVLDIGSNFI